MSYGVYFKYDGERYKLPVNPEEIKKTQKLNIEKYQVLGSGAVSIPTYADLWEYSFECELPHTEVHYMEPGSCRSRQLYPAVDRCAKNKSPFV